MFAAHGSKGNAFSWARDKFFCLPDAVLAQTRFVWKQNCEVWARSRALLDCCGLCSIVDRVIALNDLGSKTAVEFDKLHIMAQGAVRGMR